MSAPFDLKFTVDGKYFVYDVPTNNILEVDRDLYDALDLVTGGQTGQDEAGAALAQVQFLNRTEGLFSTERPPAMRFPFSREELRLILDQLTGHVILNVTENCNLRCGYCKFSGAYPHVRPHSSAQMTPDVAVRAVDFMMAHARYLVEETDEHLSVGFYGGEPLLAASVIRAVVDHLEVRYPAVRDRVNVALTTNLTIDDERTIRYLVERRVSLLVSLDGPRLLHDRYRRSVRGAGSFDMVARNLRRILDLDREYYEQNVGFSVVLAPPYDLEAVADFFRDEPLVAGRRVILSFVDKDDTTFFDQFEMPRMQSALAAQMAALRQRFIGGLDQGAHPESELLARMFGSRLAEISRRPVGAMGPYLYPNGICIPGYQRFLVSPAGRFYVCEKIGYDLPIGDLESGFDIDAIEAMIRDYIAVSESRCRECWAARFCRMCYRSALKGGGFDEARKEENCRTTRRSILEALRTYAHAMGESPQILRELYGTPSEGRGMDVPVRFLEGLRRAGNSPQRAPMATPSS